MDLIGRGSEVEQNHVNLAAIAGVDGGRRVGKGDGVFEREAAARADLRFEARREFDGEPGGHERGLVGLEHDIRCGMEVEPGVFVRTVGVAGKLSLGAETADSDLHGVLAMITVCLKTTLHPA